MLNFITYVNQMKKIQFLYSIFFFLLFCSCKETTSSAVKIPKSIIADHAAVVTAHPLATEVGIKILKEGGNAIDACVATQFALAVVYPRAGNIGGGGFLVYRSAENEKTTLDFRETAPNAASKNMYLDEQGEIIPDLSRLGGLSVGVPGTVHGMESAHQKFGKLPWKELLEPAIQLAQNGFNISNTEADRLNKYKDDFVKINKNKNPFIKNTEWNGNDLLVQTELSSTLRKIQSEGSSAFYKGSIAQRIVECTQKTNGIITLKDLSEYISIWRKPVKSKFNEYTIYSMPPPSSGGIALSQLLGILDLTDIENYDFQSAEAMHLIAETERRVYADRAKHLGDADFYHVPQDSLLSNQYLLAAMEDIDLKKASLSDDIMAGDFVLPEEGFQTTHTSIVDSMGNAVSITTTLNLNYGSKLYVDGAGFFLNNEMDDFSAKPGVPNYFGLIGAEANAIAPKKRMLSSMTPTIVEKNNELFLVVGSPGGSTIITTVFQVFLNLAIYDKNLEEAVSALRFHHQWLPDRILVEENYPIHAFDALKKMGHTIDSSSQIGIAKAIHITQNGLLHAVGDYRNPDDCALGY